MADAGDAEMYAVTAEGELTFLLRYLSIAPVTDSAPDPFLWFPL